MKSKGIITVIVIVLLGISILYFTTWKQSQKYSGPVEKVSIGISATSLLPSLVHIAKEKGYFLEEGIDMEIKGYPTGKKALEATLKGEVDMCTVADMPVVSNSFKRNDFTVFGTILQDAEHTKCLARKDRNISTPQDLIGKKVATTIGTTAHYFMATFFIFNGLDLEDVEIVDLNPTEMVEAIVKGNVDAIFTWEPNIYHAEKDLGDNGVILPSDVGYLATFNLVSKNDFIENNQQLLKRILKALIKAEEFTKDNREESVDIIAARLKTDREIIDKLWGMYEFRVSLTQAFLITLEGEARWFIKNKLTSVTEIPNYLDYIYWDALEAVKPEAVGIIH
ncbi:hypothetical protein B6228_01635 [Candidatus Atribacteria bacterium 4572_76]|nr:MAG: hypothetical protein B6228_01635 [Candidatus Atribacteria bacterium 4572_76]